MSGTIAGGRKTHDTNIEKYGIDFYKRIGAMGGKLGSAEGVIKGFAANRELASRAGKIGGMKSRRVKSK